jgi:anti-sigma factor RsiW
MHDTWTDRLSAYLDDDMTPAERLEMERHLLDCAACRETLEDLRSIVAAGQSLEDQPPAVDLWPGIAAAIGAGAHRGWRSVPWPAAIAAGVLLAVTSALSAWVMLGGSTGPPRESIVQAPTAVLQPVVSVNAPYGAAVEDLLEVLRSRRHRLNPRTVAVLEGSLATIDRAIAEATTALEQDPGDVSLASDIAGQRQLKLAVLRQVERLTVGEP